MSEGKEFTSLIEGKDVKLKLLAENVSIQRKCDEEYHIAYTQLIQKGLLPKATLEKKMVELDIWSDEDEKTLEGFQKDLLDLQINLDKAQSHDEGLVIAKEMGEHRSACLKLVEAKAAVLSNSAESLADNIRRDAYIAYATVRADTNKRIFKDYHDFLVRSEEPIVLSAREVILTLATEGFQEALMALPEIHYVYEVEAQITKEAIAVEKAEAKAAKKTSSKKTGKKTSKKKVTKKTKIKD